MLNIDPPHKLYQGHSLSRIAPADIARRIIAVSSWATPTDKARWIITLSILAYPMLGTLVAFTSLPSLVASVPVRVLVLLLSLFLVLSTPRWVWTSSGVWLFFLFWVMYFARLMWDWHIVGIPQASEFTLNFIIFSIPTALAFIQPLVINERKLGLQLISIGVFTCFLVILAYYTGLTAERSTTELVQGRLFLETVNPITFGHVGVTVLIAALSMASYCNRKIEWAFLASAAIAGCAVVQLAGSRGPLLALVVCVLALVLIRKYYRWLLLLILFFVGLLMSVDVPEESDNVLVSRLYSSLSNDDPEIRILMLEGAWRQFYDSPWFGSGILETQFEDYPHNVFLEAAMAVGLSGLLLLTFISLIALWRIFSALREGELLLPLLALQSLVAAQVSGSISQSASMWMFLVMYASAGMRRRVRQLPSAVNEDAKHI